MTTEDRLRELLCDPGWSLPAWPDVEARVRRAARRQRVALARVTAAVTAVITTAAVVPVLLLSRSPGTAFGSAANFGPAASPFALPPVGAVGFTSAIYPAPVQAKAAASWLTWCPSPEGLQAPGQEVSLASRTVLRQLAVPAGVNVTVPEPGRAANQLVVQYTQHVFADDLRLSDRAIWPRLASSGGGVIAVVRQAGFLPVIYSGPLRAYHPANGPPALAEALAAGCGSRIVGDTWVIVSGHAASPARAAETFFLKRRGHVLLYNATSRPA